MKKKGSFQTLSLIKDESLLIEGGIKVLHDSIAFKRILQSSSRVSMFDCNFSGFGSFEGLTFKREKVFCFLFALKEKRKKKKKNL